MLFRQVPTAPPSVQRPTRPYLTTLQSLPCNKLDSAGRAPQKRPDGATSLPLPAIHHASPPLLLPTERPRQVGQGRDQKGRVTLSCVLPARLRHVQVCCFFGHGTPVHLVRSTPWTSEAARSPRACAPRRTVRPRSGAAPGSAVLRLRLRLGGCQRPLLPVTGHWLRPRILPQESLAHSARRAPVAPASRSAGSTRAGGGVRPHRTPAFCNCGHQPRLCDGHARAWEKKNDCGLRQSGIAVVRR